MVIESIPGTLIERLQSMEAFERDPPADQNDLLLVRGLASAFQANLTEMAALKDTWEGSAPAIGLTPAAAALERTAQVLSRQITGDDSRIAITLVDSVLAQTRQLMATRDVIAGLSPPTLFGDVIGPDGGTADTEIALFADTTGKLLKRGALKVTAGGNLDRAASTFTIYLNSNELLRLRASSGVDFFAVRDGNGQASIEGEGDSADINLKFIPKGVGWSIFDGTGAVLVPDGTTAQRPGTPADGMIRYNTTTSLMETYENGAWTPLVGASTSHAATHVPGATDVLPDLRFFNGTFLETMDALVTSDGAIVTMTIEQSGGGDLTMKFSDGRTTFDCTPAASIALTPGTDASPQGNFVYILQSTKALTKSTSDWPSAEHIKIAYFLVPTASLVNTGATGNNFVYVNHNWNDHSKGTNGQGHLSHLTERSRQLGAQWRDGCLGTATQDGNDLWVSVASGTVYQMHRHTFAALDSDTVGAGDTILVVNDPDAAYTIINSLNSITKHSNGDLIGNNKFVKFVLWGVVNKSGEISPMMLNLPSEHYNTQDDAATDVDGVANFTIPTEFQEESTTGFLIAAFVCKHTATAMEIQETIDLRGQITATATGAGTGGGDVTAAAALTDHAIVRGDGGAKGVQTGTPSIGDDGVMSVPGIGDGGYTNYDLKVGDTTTPDYGMIQIGNAAIGRTSHVSGAIDLDGVVMIRNISGPVTSEVEFIIVEATGNTCRLAIPKSAVGNTTYHPRSLIVGPGPAPADTDFVKISYWQGLGWFPHLTCDTDGLGADFGVQRNIEYHGTLHGDTFEESTTGAGIAIQPGAGGDVNLFGVTDVADAAAGKSLFIHRKAAEGDDSLRLYVANDGDAVIDASDALTIISAVDKDLWLLSGNDVILGLGDDAGADKVEVQDVNLNVVGTWDSDGNITLDGTVDGRDVAADGVVLDELNARRYTQSLMLMGG